MNIITFDIEEWYLRQCKGANPERIVVLDRYLDNILSLLEEKQQKGTFFCLGGMATTFPHVVKLIQKSGHEIGCHSNEHGWLNKMSIEKCKEDTYRAIDSLEQCIGEKVKSYRAPAFSIGEHNKWAFEILAENGIENDASVFPTSRDYGGFAKFGQKTPCIVDYNGIRIKEFPVCTTKVLGKEIAYSGGGYFRFFPLWFVKHKLKVSPYAMCYFHIADLLPESSGFMSREAYELYFKEPGTFKARLMRHFKGNFGKKGAMMKLETLITTEQFINIIQANECIDWSRTPVVKLSD